MVTRIKIVDAVTSYCAVLFLDGVCILDTGVPTTYLGVLEKDMRRVDLTVVVPWHAIMLDS